MAVLRWAGVAYLAYLAWLGWQLLRHPAANLPGIQPPSAPPAARPLRILSRSFLVAVSNPKANLFFLALLPAFIDPQAPALAQYPVLAITFAAIDAAVLLCYAAVGSLGIARLGKALTTAWFDRISGTALLCMSLGLAFWKPGR